MAKSLKDELQAEQKKRAIETERGRDVNGRFFAKGHDERRGPGGAAIRADTLIMRDFRAACREYTVEAVRKIAHHMRGKDSRVSMMAAEFLLEHGWGKAPQTVNLKSNELQELSREELTQIIRGEGVDGEDAGEGESARVH